MSTMPVTITECLKGYDTGAGEAPLAVEAASLSAITPAAGATAPLFHVMNKNLYEITCRSSGEVDVHSLELKVAAERAVAEAGIAFICAGMNASPKDFSLSLAIVPIDLKHQSGPRHATLGVAVSLANDQLDLEAVRAYYAKEVMPRWNSVFHELRDLVQPESPQGSLTFDTTAPPRLAAQHDVEQSFLAATQERQQPVAHAGDQRDLQQECQTKAAQLLAATLQGKTLNLSLQCKDCADIEQSGRVPRSQRKPGQPEGELLFGRLNCVSKNPAEIQIIGRSLREGNKVDKRYTVSYAFSFEMLELLATCLTAHGMSEFDVDLRTHSDAKGVILTRELKGLTLPKLLPTAKLSSGAKDSD